MERPALEYFLSVREDDDNMTEIYSHRLRNTSVSVPLQYNVTYTVALLASRCEFRLNSSNVTMEIQVPTYQCKDSDDLTVIVVLAPKLLQ